ncbi:hypothetical protein RQP46_006452 [Phenoliferia psychrophenolica]
MTASPHPGPPTPSDATNATPGPGIRILHTRTAISNSAVSSSPRPGSTTNASASSSSIITRAGAHAGTPLAKRSRLPIKTAGSASGVRKVEREKTPEVTPAALPLPLQPQPDPVPSIPTTLLPKSEDDSDDLATPKPRSSTASASDSWDWDDEIRRRKDKFDALKRQLDELKLLFTGSNASNAQLQASDGPSSLAALKIPLVDVRKGLADVQEGYDAHSELSINNILATKHDAASPALAAFEFSIVNIERAAFGSSEVRSKMLQ